MPTDKDGPSKNTDVVKKQFENWVFEMALVTHKTKTAIIDKDIKKALHHVTGYLEETIDQLPRFWFYTWIPKWALVIYLIDRVGPFLPF
jgi:hypothetical protein